MVEIGAGGIVSACHFPEGRVESVCGQAVKADATVTFHRAKKGLCIRPDLVGKLVVANIGIPPEADLGVSG